MWGKYGFERSHDPRPRVVLGGEPDMEVVLVAPGHAALPLARQWGLRPVRVYYTSFFELYEVKYFGEASEKAKMWRFYKIHWNGTGFPYRCS